MLTTPQVSDPSDWPEGFAKLGELDAHLRCPICKEFLRGAVMLNCHHTFCSACLRRHLDKESTCPACRESATTAQIRRNVMLEEVANCFIDCREQLLKTVQDSIRRAKEDQERLKARTRYNGEHDADSDYNDTHYGDEDEDIAMDVESRGSSSRRSGSANPNKRARVSTRRRTTTAGSRVEAASQELVDEVEEEDDEDDADFAAVESVAQRTSQRKRRTRTGYAPAEDDFQPESPTRKRVTRQSLVFLFRSSTTCVASEQQEQQNHHQPSNTSCRTRSSARLAASRSATSPDSPLSTPSSSQTSNAAAPPPQSPPQQEPSFVPEDIGLCACPVCGCAIPQQSANQHLDLCMEGKRDQRYNAQYDQVKLMDREAMLLYAKHGTAPPPSTSSAIMTIMGSSSPSGGRRGAGGSKNSIYASPSSGKGSLNKERNGNGGASTSWSIQTGSSSSSSSPATNGSVTKYPERKPLLPKLAYGVLTEKQLRKKLQELGLATHGDKALMQKRHAEYLTRYNANCDALRPFSESELKRQMVEWERAYEMNLQAREQQRRAQEQLQRQVQEEQQLLRLSQESISLSQDAAVTSAATTAGVGTGSLTSAPSPSNSSSSTTTTTTTTTTSTFIPNVANNTSQAVAVAEAASFAHAAKYADEYAELIASVRRRFEIVNSARLKKEQEEKEKAMKIDGQPQQQLQQ
ncbi:E3 ubiquitin-protein ligase rad18 [Actinomortierella wolfii]|nr:E3 ubiquitin-protein ligase rad18 [Actinomortierella wolfii]